MSGTPPGWHPDPSGSGQLRYWDGNQWTQHTQPAGAQKSSADLLDVDISGGHDPSAIQRQVQSQAGVTPIAAGGGTIFTEPVLVVNQKTKLIEVNTEYGVFNQAGQQVAKVEQIGQSTLKKVVRFLGEYDQYFTHKFQITDGHGRVQLYLTRPGKIFKSRVIVQGGDGREIGEIKQNNMIGKINFSFNVGGQEIGKIQAENWRAWNFAILDHTGQEVARITKTFEGLLKTMFTTADNYVLQIHRPLQDPLLSMVVASALTVDVALKQDSRGWS